jgi:HK97 gp10 family phage protein
MSIEVQIIGLDKLQERARKLGVNMATQMQQAVLASVLKIEAEAKTSLNTGGKSGVVYKRRSVTHRASAPGEPPATDTGKLVSSIRSNVRRDVDGAALGTVLAGAAYAKDLEFGTSNMAARPFMFPAAEKSKPEIEQFFRTAATRALEGK